MNLGRVSPFGNCQQEWKAALEVYSGREAAKMGVSKNGLCLLVGYCIEMLMWRNLRELTG